MAFWIPRVRWRGSIFLLFVLWKSFFWLKGIFLFRIEKNFSVFFLCFFGFWKSFLRENKFFLEKEKFGSINQNGFLAFFIKLGDAWGTLKLGLNRKWSLAKDNFYCDLIYLDFCEFLRFLVATLYLCHILKPRSRFSRNFQYKRCCKECSLIQKSKTMFPIKSKAQKKLILTKSSNV